MRFVLVVLCALVDPGGDQFDFLFRQRVTAIRHPNRRVGLAGNQPVQRARGARPGDDHGPVLGTLHDMLIAIGSETALLEADPAFRVTLDTMAF